MKDKRNKGITLIALVVTIIVLLILAGISISMLAGDNSILQKSTEAKQNSEREEAKEQAQMDIMAWITDKASNHEDSSLDDSKVKDILTGKSYVKNGQPGNDSFFTAKGEYEISYSELYTASDTQTKATLPAGTYTAGQEVELNGEEFFVLEDQGNTVKLLAKYCLNQEGTAQTANHEEWGRHFSNTMYWTNVEERTYPFDLQSSDMLALARADGDVAEGVPNAVVAAEKYGKTIGNSGRLMTSNEAYTILTNGTDLMKKIISGKWDMEDPTNSWDQGNMFWWLGDAESDWSVYDVTPIARDYARSGGSPIGYTGYGVRPIVFVSES